MAWMSRFREVTYALLRVVAGLLFMQHGAQKLFGWFGGMGGSGATADLFSQMGLAGVIEFFGGLLIALGLFTGIVAFIAAGQMAAAYILAHAPQAFWPIENGGELAALFCFTWLFFAAHGSGRFSLDALLGREREPADPAAYDGVAREPVAR